MGPDPTVRDRVDRQLRSFITDGSVLPGESLAVGVLAKRWRVSETPVREAAWRAVGEGLLYVDPRGGFRVWLPDVERLRDAYDCLALLVVDAITLADMSAIQRVANDAMEGDGDIHDPVGQFMISIGRLSGNTALLGTIEQAVQRLALFSRVEPIIGFDPVLDALDIGQSLRAGSRAGVREQIRRYCRRRRISAPIMLGVIEEQRRSQSARRDG